ncbi:hypothetical protein EON63_04350 [archaeon]|nr:MAG: hypothetical protein EON63_04350 [archaeon]
MYVGRVFWCCLPCACLLMYVCLRCVHLSLSMGMYVHMYVYVSRYKSLALLKTYLIEHANEITQKLRSQKQQA